MNSPDSRIVIISAMSRDRIIGSGDGMPWHVPEEYQHFLDTTAGQTIIIGRRSFEIFGPTLTSEHCYVVTRGESTFKNAFTANSLQSALDQAKRHGRTVYVSGGASIYSAAIGLVDSMQLSYIDGEFSGDTYFPDVDEADWTVTRREDRGSYEFVEYLRKRAK